MFFLVGKFVLQRKPKKRVFSFSHIAPFRQGENQESSWKSRNQEIVFPGKPGKLLENQNKHFSWKTRKCFFLENQDTCSFLENQEKSWKTKKETFLLGKPGKHRKVPVNQEKMFFLGKPRRKYHLENQVDTNITGIPGNSRSTWKSRRNFRLGFWSFFLVNQEKIWKTSKIRFPGNFQENV